MAEQNSNFAFAPLPKNPRFQNLAGETYGRLFVLGLASPKRRTWICKCNCGDLAIVASAHLKTGHTVSCGCFHKQELGNRRRIHGMRDEPEYRNVYMGMLQRCYNKKSISYHLYGGRGIRVCDRWRKSFKNFMADLGRRPSKRHTLDRYPNNNGNYQPDNCRWATPKQQGRNTRRTRMLEHHGKTQCMADWAAEIGIRSSLLHKWLKTMSLQEAIKKAIELTGTRAMKIPRSKRQLGILPEFQ